MILFDTSDSVNRVAAVRRAAYQNIYVRQGLGQVASTFRCAEWVPAGIACTLTFLHDHTEQEQNKRQLPG